MVWRKNEAAPTKAKTWLSSSKMFMTRFLGFQGCYAYRLPSWTSQYHFRLLKQIVRKQNLGILKTELNFQYETSLFCMTMPALIPSKQPKNSRIYSGRQWNTLHTVMPGLDIMWLSHFFLWNWNLEDLDSMRTLLRIRSCITSWKPALLVFNSGIKNLPILWWKCVLKSGELVCICLKSVQYIAKSKFRFIFDPFSYLNS